MFLLFQRPFLDQSLQRTHDRRGLLKYEIHFPTLHTTPSPSCPFLPLTHPHPQSSYKPPLLPSFLRFQAFYSRATEMRSIQHGLSLFVFQTHDMLSQSLLTFLSDANLQYEMAFLNICIKGMENRIYETQPPSILKFLISFVPVSVFLYESKLWSPAKLSCAFQIFLKIASNLSQIQAI